MERIFAVVLLFGAGVDYALFWISRYREALRDDVSFNPAVVRATEGSGPAIMASAATTICGLTTMLATDLVPTQSAGKVSEGQTALQVIKGLHDVGLEGFAHLQAFIPFTCLSRCGAGG